jgi:probable rRNA maturation factor
VASRRIGKFRAAEPADIRVSARAGAPLSEGGVRRLAAAVIKAEGGRVAALSITFLGPVGMRTLNRQHLGHDWATDVLAFGMTTAMGNSQWATGSPFPIAHSPLPLVGDIYICPAVAVRDARRFGSTPKAEVRRLVIHGILHILGYDHPDGKHRTASAMWHTQERHLARFGRLAR